MLIGETSHINWSVGQATSHPTYGQIFVESIPDNNGTLEIEDIVNSINSENEPQSNVKLICLENTQNSSFGIPLDPDYIESVQNITRGNKLAIHIDGARIFNAAVALQLSPSRLVKHADSITFCLSKGLGCPIGAIICGSKDFIDEAHNRRKITGGEMRQTGVFAAAGIVALETMVDRLAEDHFNARLLAEGLETIDGIEIDSSRVKTNIVYFKPLNRSAKTIEQSLGAAGVHCFALDGRIRMVTHHDIKPKDIETTLKIVQTVFISHSNSN
jgi:threonine aldolase